METYCFIAKVDNGEKVQRIASGSNWSEAFLQVYDAIAASYYTWEFLRSWRLK